MNMTDFALMTAFNTAVCLILPRLITINWSNLASNAQAAIDETEKVTSETAARS